jgi:hypothetical protein
MTVEHGRGDVGRGIEIVGAVDGGTAWTGHVERSGHGRHSRGMFERARQVTKVLEPRDGA